MTTRRQCHQGLVLGAPSIPGCVWSSLRSKSGSGNVARNRAATSATGASTRHVRPNPRRIAPKREHDQVPDPPRARPSRHRRASSSLSRCSPVQPAASRPTVTVTVTVPTVTSDGPLGSPDSDRAAHLGRSSPFVRQAPRQRVSGYPRGLGPSSLYPRSATSTSVSRDQLWVCASGAWTQPTSPTSFVGARTRGRGPAMGQSSKILRRPRRRLVDQAERRPWAMSPWGNSLNLARGFGRSTTRLWHWSSNTRREIPLSFQTETLRRSHAARSQVVGQFESAAS